MASYISHTLAHLIGSIAKPFAFRLEFLPCAKESRRTWCTPLPPRRRTCAS